MNHDLERWNRLRHRATKPEDNPKARDTLGGMNSSHVPPTNNHQALPRVNDSAGLLGGVAANTITDAKAAVAATKKNAVR